MWHIAAVAGLTLDVGPSACSQRLGRERCPCHGGPGSLTGCVVLGYPAGPSGAVLLFALSWRPVIARCSYLAVGLTLNLVPSWVLAHRGDRRLRPGASSDCRLSHWGPAVMFAFVVGWGFSQTRSRPWLWRGYLMAVPRSEMHCVLFLLVRCSFWAMYVGRWSSPLALYVGRWSSPLALYVGRWSSPFCFVCG